MSAAVLTLSFPQSSVRDAVCACPCPCSAAALAAGRAQAGEGGAVGPGRLRESSGRRAEAGQEPRRGRMQGEAPEHTQGNRAGTGLRQ